MKQTTRKDRAGKRFSSERSVLRRFMAEALFRKDSIFRCKILSLLYEAICFYPCIHHLCSLRRSGAGERRHDRHGVLLPAAAGAARGRAGQPDLRGGAARRAGSRCLRAGASGRPAPRRRVCRRGDLLARARIPRHGRCRGAGRKFGRRPDGHSHPLALRRQRETVFGRGDALVRRAGRRHAGRGSALLYLLYLDAADDGRLRRFRPPGRGARPPQSQRDPFST